MVKSIQKTISYPSDYFSVQDIRDAFEKREFEMKIDRQQKLILKKTHKLDIANKIIDFMKQGIAFEVAEKLAGQ